MVLRYIKGQWEEARSIMAECGDAMPDDQPVKTLLRWMDEFDAKPDGGDWPGYRTADSK
jgi:hypothetical protein